MCALWASVAGIHSSKQELSGSISGLLFRAHIGLLTLRKLISFLYEIICSSPFGMIKSEMTLYLEMILTQPVVSFAPDLAA